MATIGVKIELEGAPQYKENMSNLTAQTRLYQAQLKRLDAEMSSGASAYQKSIAQSKALAQQLEAQKNQQKLLEEQIAKTTEKYGEDSTQVIRLKTQYEKLTEQIAKTNQALEDNGGMAGAIGAQFDAISSKLDAVGQKVGAVADGLTKGITVPVMAMGAASLKAFNDVDAGMDTIVQKTGATGEALEEMQNIARDIATSIPTSFDAAGAAVGEVNTRFGVMGDELTDLSTKFIKFAELNGTDVSSSIDSVQAAMAAFNIESSDAGKVLDILNKAGQDSGISMDALANSLLSNASSLTEMGFSIESASGLIANLEKNGVDSAAAMAGLKKAFANATSDGKTMEQALSELDAAMKASGSDTEAYQAALELFGNKAGPQLAKAIQEGRLSLDAASNAITDYGDSVTKTFESTEDPVDQFEVNMNKLKLVGEDIVNSAAPLITDVMEKMGQAIQKVSDAWNSLDEGQKQAVIQAALVAAAIGPVLKAISSVINTVSVISSTISSFVTFIPTIATALSGIGAVITGTVIPAIGAAVTALLPVLPIIAGVAAAVAAAIVIVKNWGAITDFVSEKWGVLTEFLSQKTQEIQTFFSEHLGIIGDLFATKIELIKITIQTAVQVIEVIFRTLGDVVKAIMDGDFAEVAEILRNAWVEINQIINKAIAKAVITIMNLAVKVKDIFKDLALNALEWGQHLIENFIDGIMAKVDALKETISNVAQTVKDFLGFTEPKKGPLHGSTVWPEHFMENYSHGIENAKYLVQNAVADVAADVSVLSNPLDAAAIYEAVRSGASDAAISFGIGDREFTRALRDMGVQFNG